MEKKAISISTSEAYRYLGGKGTPDEKTELELENAGKMVLNCASPRVIKRSFRIDDNSGLAVAGTPMLLEGKSIAALLNSCKDCVLFCTTIGNEIEALLRKWQIKNIAFAAMLDACASSAVESLCELVEREIYDEYKAQELYLTDRFSPGYGDFPLSVQREFCAVLDTPRKIGVCVNESGIMIPRKSVTAIIGISEHPQKHMNTGCADCRQSDGCKFRESGLTCYGQAV